MTSRKLTEVIKDKKWRLNNLYRIIDKNSDSIPFKLNYVQNEVLENLHTRNLILKARQLGMSTFAVLYLLDQVLFTNNLSAGIVSYSLEHAQYIFKKIIGHALDTFPDKLKPDLGILQRSAREISFTNGSSIRVDTTLRGGSYPLVLVSEFGKTCARNPIKAEEVVTGTLQAVPKNGRVIVESTGEGQDGYFSDMVFEALARGDTELNELDYKLFFFSWLDEPNYILKQRVDYDYHLTDYFESVERKLDITLTDYQKNWYAMQSKLLGDKTTQEFPSSIEEAFRNSSEAYYYSDGITRARQENRLLTSSLYDTQHPLYVAMDIGVNDLTVMVFFQVVHGEIRILDYYDDKNKGLDFYAKFLLQDKNYLYHTIFLPHDSKKRDVLDVTQTYEYKFRELFSGTATNFTVLPKMDKQISISNSKIILNRCVFNISKTKKYLDMLSKYRKKWSDIQNRYIDEPMHNISSNYADSFQYLCQAVPLIERRSSTVGSLDKHRDVVASRKKKII